MNDFLEFAKKVEKFDVNLILYEVWKNPKVKDYIVALNTKGVSGSQLYDLGVDSLGVKLGNYTNYTKEIKLSGSGDKKVDHITLIDTGEFYDSFFVNAFPNGFSIEADGQKPDGNILDRFGKDVIGLTDESFKRLIEFIQPFFIKEANKRLS